jgi:hypothetical protein
MLGVTCLHLRFPLARAAGTLSRVVELPLLVEPSNIQHKSQAPQDISTLHFEYTTLLLRSNFLEIKNLVLLRKLMATNTPSQRLSISLYGTVIIGGAIQPVGILESFRSKISNLMRFHFRWYLPTSMTLSFIRWVDYCRSTHHWDPILY